MPTRGSGAPPITRGQQCRKCGADEWFRKNRTYACQSCHRRLAAASDRRRSPARKLLSSAKQRARASGLSFTITEADIDAVWPADNRCPVLGIPLRTGPGKPHDNSPTLDRLVNAWGYEPGNIAVISYAANRAKGNMRAQDLERIAAWMRAKGLD